MKTNKRFIRFFTICLLIILTTNNTKAQVANQVLWVKADKGVNSSTGVPAATNTQITTWYDQATTDGSQNGGIPTVDPGQPEANLPVLPYYKYSSSAADNFNHNPVINFSYLNYGNAVQFTTPALGSQTVFTVFRAAGTGWYYDTMLLYGGDISNPSAGDPAPERADMAFSVWTSSRLNVWGGSVGDFYGLGNLKLETQISIGTLKRNRVSDENVTHSIFGNGSTDVLNLNADPDNSRTGEGRDLSGMVRIGKHFSGTTVADAVAARLNGQFAELMVYNTVLTDVDRAKVESYLAVKYGITLTGGTRLLGSTVGNSSYPYVNSSGTTIRASDATYKYDVFGLGRDDYFGLDQRISKSNNTNDILTASTNSDFTSLNLDKTRTAINGDKEFMLFGNNKGSSVAVTTQTTELPTDVTSRLDREWKVNYSNTDGSNIQNVSLKFDLSGFTFTGATIDNLMLLIDTDGDGDFTTGTISTIPASTFVSGSNVTFNNINLTDGYVFTLGIVSYTDSDGDGVPDYLDLDDDNDGILDCVEKGLSETISNIFKLNGSTSEITSTEVQLTPAVNSQSGQMWSYGKIDFTKSFSFSFDAFLGSNDGGADGIAIVFHNDPAGVNAIGSNGEGIGARGIQNGIVLELDTYTNTIDPGSPSGPDHGQIWRSSDQTAISTPISLPNLENGLWHTVIVSWNATTQTLNYTVDGTSAGSYTGDVVNNFFGGVSKVYFGYTASTGGLNNDQRIRFSTLCNTPLEIDTDGDGVPNHLDLDSDGDGCPDAVEGDENVTFSQLTNNAISGTVDTNGVPVIVNSGGTADVGNDEGQEIGQSQDASKNDCIDTDGDGIANWQDLDDDNDGILDIVECGCNTDVFVNGDFESPAIPYNGGWNTTQSQTNIPGWQTTASDGMIEYWPTAGNGGDAFSGSQFAELNANMTSTLYQTFCFPGYGGTVNWSVRHRGRDGVDVAEVRIGTSLSSYTTVATMSDGPGTWGLYSGTYTVPVGVTELYIMFSSVSTSTGDQTAGNFLDDIQITLNQVCVDTDNDGIPDHLDTDSDNDGCPDAIEAAADIYEYDLTSLTDGSNGGSSLNLGTKVDTDPTSDTYGVPIKDANDVDITSIMPQGLTDAVADVDISDACKADLSLEKEVQQPLGTVVTDVQINSTIYYVLTLTNDGPHPVRGVQVTDNLPTGLINISGSGTVGTFNSSSGVWNLGTHIIGVGETEILTITATVGPDCGSLTNFAEVTAMDRADIDSTPNNGE